MSEEVLKVGNRKKEAAGAEEEEEDRGRQRCHLVATTTNQLESIKQHDFMGDSTSFCTAVASAGCKMLRCTAQLGVFADEEEKKLRSRVRLDLHPHLISVYLGSDTPPRTRHGSSSLHFSRRATWHPAACVAVGFLWSCDLIWDRYETEAAEKCSCASRPPNGDETDWLPGAKRKNKICWKTLQQSDLTEKRDLGDCR